MDEFRTRTPHSPAPAASSKTLERLGAAALAIGGAALKFGFIFVKFFGFFFSVAAYALWFHSWTFALGFVLMIFVHELGHIVEARLAGPQGVVADVHPVLRRVRDDRAAGLTPWRNAIISLAGPLFGGAAAAVVWAIGDGARLVAAARARQHRVPAERVQPAPDRLPRRRRRSCTPRARRGGCP